ncbi:beta-ketoacyl synthase chain length factor [uncultured Umboniibacter sp.]|uniref:beta-ketoacyl synthase chain length factor n=1 Tax=uncultured Umboniibacter sp. TaxID=1798917 RepID=UPI002626948D|nr:beta-ketoacyl synthase chain length factor [uncultured Umboniibacter sp.]
MTIDKLMIKAIAIDVEVEEQERLIAAGIPEAVFTAGLKLPAMLNRRLSPTGKRAAALANELLNGEGLTIVWCSQYGDLARTQRLMESIVADEPMSPTDFSLSVQNAEPGILSMATKNHKHIVAISAAKHRFYNALLEAELLRREQATDVLLVMTDQSVPEIYAPVSAINVATTSLVLRISDSGRAFSLLDAKHLDDSVGYTEIFRLLVNTLFRADIDKC